MTNDLAIHIELTDDGVGVLTFGDHGQRIDLLAPSVLDALKVALKNGQRATVDLALRNVFTLCERNQCEPDIASENVLTPIRSVGVVGAGIMGQGIAAANVKRGVPVTMIDADADALAEGVRLVRDEIGCDAAAGCQPAAIGMLRGTDLVIESIKETLDAKKRLFAEIEPLIRDDVILCSNTSTIPITKLAEDLVRPENFCGLHFFNPVRRMTAVEVVRGEKTSDATVAAVVSHAKRLGKFPVVVGDAPGFLVNRLLLPYVNEALQLVVEGASLRQIDDAATAFGMPIGPITLLDLVGLDTSAQAGLVLYNAYPDRIIPSRLLISLFKSGRLGLKNGSGFYTYPDGTLKSRECDPEIDAFLAEHADKQKTCTHTQNALINRMILPMVLEATRVLEAGIVRDARDVDLSLIFGIGFPPFRGGLLYWADRLGAAAILEELQSLSSLGKRYEPTSMLHVMAGSGGTFYDGNS